MSRRVPPHNLEAELSLLGAVVARPSQISDIARQIDAADFYAPHHAATWDLLVRMSMAGEQIDTVILADKLQSTKTPLPGGKTVNDYVFEINGAIASADAGRYVKIVAKHSTSRALLRAAAEIAERAYEDLDDPDAVLDEARAILANVEPSLRNVAPDGLLTLDQFLDRPKQRELERRPWVVPGMLRAGWRALFVATEGAGKSTILRQMAIMVATGLHPFTPIEIPPQRTLIVDVENPDEVIDEQGLYPRNAARRQLKDRYISDNCYLWSREAGIDIRQRVDRARLEAVIAKVQPKLVVLGPLYKTFRAAKHEGEEQPVMEVQAILDDLRTRYGFALVMEHHAPHGSGDRSRDLRPLGSSAWLRWPEFGFKLSPVPEKSRHPQGSLKIGRFRKDRLPATWPTILERHREWTGIWPDGTFDEPLEGF